MMQEQSVDTKHLVSLCTVRSGEEIFGIETTAVHEAIVRCKPQRVPLAPFFVAGMVPYRGDILLAVSLRALRGLAPETEASCAVVLQDAESGELFALLTDELLDVADLETDKWEPNPQTLDRARRELYRGVYRTAGAPVVRLETSDVQPTWLMRSRNTAAGMETHA